MRKYAKKYVNLCCVKDQDPPEPKSPESHMIKCCMITGWMIKGWKIWGGIIEGIEDNSYEKL